MKNWKKIIVTVVILVLLAVSYGWFLYTKKTVDTRKQTADIELRSVDLLSAFKMDESAASRKYIDKVLIVSGKVMTVQVTTNGQATLILNAEDPFSSVTCSFYSDGAASVKTIMPGTMVRVKGMCTGILSDVILNKCSLVK
jgi:hypothetical protein